MELNNNQIKEIENKEWLDSIEYVLKHEGASRVGEIMKLLSHHVRGYGVDMICGLNTPYINTIPAEDEVEFPGDREIEMRIKSFVRWNAMAMVVQANKKKEGIGGHISTYASAATLYEIGFNHFFRGHDGQPGDIVYYQGHASPGIYARSFLEGNISKKALQNFRRELQPGGGLPSYPHPMLKDDYWQFPTVSMGLSPIMAIYQARFNHYLKDKGVRDTANQKVWAFLGDGEMDEPESMGGLTLAAREELDNLIFVINCNLQRLDGPVRGNSSIVQEMEAAFRGAGWNVIKVLLGSNWDPLLEKDTDGRLKKRLGELVDGERQRFSIADGEFIRREFFGRDKHLLKLVEDLSDDDIRKLRRGGHDPQKVYNAYKAAAEHKGSPTVILAQTIKGYGLGEAGEGRNITHQQKKLNEDELKHFRDRFDIPISDKELADAPFYKPKENSKEIKYLKDKRKNLGGYIPKREKSIPNFQMPDNSLFEEYYKGSGKREVATTMTIVQMLSKLLKDQDIGKLIVPIVPDESRTFGMDALFRQVGIYAHKGQLYEPVDKQSLLYYKEQKDGAILEEGITEAGSMSSFIAAGTAYSTHKVNCVPFYVFYSMFGFQRIGDFIWAAADSKAKGFLIGGTAGRTTLAGEGLQHQDGQSHLMALSVPTLQAYDPAFAYELAVIVKNGMERMYKKGEDIFYYITVMNEKYTMPSMPKNNKVEEGIIQGAYKYKASKENEYNIHLLGSGSILNESLRASEILKDEFGISSEVWSVTSYKALYDNAKQIERENRLTNKNTRNYIQKSFPKERGVYVAATDYVKALPLSVSKNFNGSFTALGTDGFGLSEHRDELREHFKVNAKHIAWSTLYALNKEGKIDKKKLDGASEKLDVSIKK